MMVMGVNHAAKDSRVCSINTTMPLSKTAAYNSVRLVDFLPEITVSDVASTRFYCTTRCVVRIFGAAVARRVARGEKRRVRVSGRLVAN
jgi:hypothetical protein